LNQNAEKLIKGSKDFNFSLVSNKNLSNIVSMEKNPFLAQNQTLMSYRVYYVPTK